MLFLQEDSSQALCAPDQVPKEDAHSCFPKFFPRPGGREPSFEPRWGALSLQGSKACSHPPNTPFSPWISVLSLSQIRIYLGLEGMTPYFSVCRMRPASEFKGPQNKEFILICGELLIFTMHFILFLSVWIFFFFLFFGFLPEWSQEMKSMCLNERSSDLGIWGTWIKT